jgi:hypothetical protein
VIGLDGDVDVDDDDDDGDDIDEGEVDGSSNDDDDDGWDVVWLVWDRCVACNGRLGLIEIMGV